MLNYFMILFMPSAKVFMSQRHSNIQQKHVDQKQEDKK